MGWFWFWRTAKRHPLGRLHAPDPRDARYPMRAFLPLRVPETRFWQPGPVLDQERLRCDEPGHVYCRERGFCVGCAWWGWLAARPLRTLDGPDPLDIYHRAQELDEWPGGAESYAGTSVRAGVKALTEQGRVERYVWARDADEVAAWIATYGPVVLGTHWYPSMFRPARDGRLAIGWFERPVGGHAYLAYGYDAERGVVWIQNSWGEAWGRGGQAYLELELVERLLREDGEACAAIERLP